MLTNTDDEDVHDLVLDTGAHSGRLAPGETASVEVGVVGRDLEGWCSVIGHKQMGMVLTVDVSGSAPTTPAGTSEGHAAHQHGPGGNDADQSPAETDRAAEGEQTPARDNLDLMAELSPGWAARDAALPPLPERRPHRRTFVVRDVLREVSPGSPSGCGPTRAPPRVTATIGASAISTIRAPASTVMARAPIETQYGGVSSSGPNW